jgi:hypothetical protein
LVVDPAARNAAMLPGESEGRFKAARKLSANPSVTNNLANP